MKQCIGISADNQVLNKLILVLAETNSCRRFPNAFTFSIRTYVKHRISVMIKTGFAVMLVFLASPGFSLHRLPLLCVEA